MTWTDRLKEFSGFGNEPDRRAETATLLPMMTAALARLNTVADLAPTPKLQADVRPVVAKADAVVQEVRDVLRDFGHAAPAGGGVVAEPDGHNHWARLLHALEQHREVRQRLREIAISVEDTDPVLGDALMKVGREEGVVVEHLRDLIALADPQALN